MKLGGLSSTPAHLFRKDGSGWNRAPLTPQDPAAQFLSPPFEGRSFLGWTVPGRCLGGARRSTKGGQDGILTA